MRHTRSEFVARAVLARMRGGHLPGPTVAPHLDSLPFIDTLRSRVQAEDVQWLLSLVQMREPGIAGLAVSALRGHLSRNVYQIFQERWKDAPVYLQHRLMWRLLDDPQLDPVWQNRFTNFIFDNWQAFCDCNRQFFGEGGLTALVERLGDDSFRSAKHWIYYCCAPAVVDESTARAFLVFGQRQQDDRCRKICSKLLQEGWLDKLPEPRRNAADTHTGALHYVAEAVVDLLRRDPDERPFEAESGWLNRMPVIDAIRQYVRPDDLTWLLPSIDVESRQTRAFLLSLLQPHSNRPDVRDRLQAYWRDPGADAYTRAHLMWRILDDPDLPREWHERLCAFVFAEWKTFAEVCGSFTNDESMVVHSLKRMNDTRMPATKHWVYLCLASCAPETEQIAARTLIGMKSSDAEAFVKTVASRLLTRTVGKAS
jgi:hypothetical protein